MTLINGKSPRLIVDKLKVKRKPSKLVSEICNNANNKQMLTRGSSKTVDAVKVKDANDVI